MSRTLRLKITVDKTQADNFLSLFLSALGAFIDHQGREFGGSISLTKNNP
jgi:hypothetical protein